MELYEWKLVVPIGKSQIWFSPAYPDMTLVVVLCIE